MSKRRFGWPAAGPEAPFARRAQDRKRPRAQANTTKRTEACLRPFRLPMIWPRAAVALPANPRPRLQDGQRRTAAHSPDAEADAISASMIRIVSCVLRGVAAASARPAISVSAKYFSSK